MKKILIIFAVALLSGSASVAQDDVINDIRAKFKVIRTDLPKYDTTMMEIWDESTEGGEAIGYFENKAVKLIQVTWYGEMGKRIMEYYFHNGVLFFAFSQNFQYNRPIYYDEEMAKEMGDSEVFDETKTKVEEDRYYFHNDTLVRWLDPEKKMVDVETEESKTTAADLIEHAKEMKAKLSK